MKINQIELTNFRIYQGKNILDLSSDGSKNINIVSGHNGYGKTTLLMSLVWCLYGKLMRDVDEKYRKEINEAGGYKRYASKSLNRKIKSGFSQLREGLSQRYKSSSVQEKRIIKEKLNELNSYSVSISFSDLFIPTLQCEELIITRSYNAFKNIEKLSILIDGKENELTKQVGSEIFINDFLLPKEIAKFFFFDAEKIVSLAEIKTSDEKKILSKAYSEVLGIKKYEDLKANLENLKTRLRNKSASKTDLKKYEKLTKKKEENINLLQLYNVQIEKLEEEIISRRKDSDYYQEKLIRQGSSLSLSEIKELKSRKEELSIEGKKINSEMREMVELAPFAIASKSMERLKEQIDLEQEHKTKELSAGFLQRKTNAIRKEILTKQKELNLESKTIDDLLQIIANEFEFNESDKSFRPLLNYNNEQVSSFYSLYHNVKGSYTERMKRLQKELKIHQSKFNSVINKLRNAESKEDDPVVREIRRSKIEVDELISKLTEKLIDLKAKIQNINLELTTNAKLISEMQKKIRLDKQDQAKDKTTNILIAQLDSFIKELKLKKKGSLEEKLKLQINKLMHKASFVNKVEVIMEGELIDIELYNKDGELINKDGLSMGERQLYATALLKGLIDESNIEFPIFIDSPLQKLDAKHSKNVITEFYPNASSQVILFPLLEGELTLKEYKLMLPKVNKSYLIENEDFENSSFKRVLSKELFDYYENQKINV